VDRPLERDVTPVAERATTTNELSAVLMASFVGNILDNSGVKDEVAAFFEFFVVLSAHAFAKIFAPIFGTHFFNLLYIFSFHVSWLIWQ
jgi:hypothetical protein